MLENIDEKKYSSIFSVRERWRDICCVVRNGVMVGTIGVVMQLLVSTKCTCV